MKTKENKTENKVNKKENNNQTQRKIGKQKKSTKKRV